MSADRNLLFGILALQMDFITRDQLVEAMHAWVLHKERALGDLLVERGALAAEDHALLAPMVERHIAKHGGDPAKSLAALSSVAPVQQALVGVEDADVQASLNGWLAARPAQEESTRIVADGPSPNSGLRYVVEGPHAKGGLGEVFVAHDQELHRKVALKHIQDRHADDPTSQSQFLREGEITGRLEHPGIVPVYGLGRYADGRPFYAMRFVQGDSLLTAIERFHHPKESLSASAHNLAFRALLGRFLDVCNAIGYAHRRGVLHRDLKPGNIMLGEFGETLVIDWGMAKVLGEASRGHEFAEEMPSTAGTLVPMNEALATVGHGAHGTPGYLSPEQAAGRIDELGPATDVYSLGAILFHLLAGRPTLTSQDGDVLGSTVRGDLPSVRQFDPKVSRALEAICIKALALTPAERHTSVEALAEDVRCWLADERVRAWREPWGVRARRWVRKHPRLVGGAAALLVGLLMTLGGAALLNAEKRNVGRANTTLDEANTNLQAALSREGLARRRADERTRVANERFTLALDTYKSQVFNANQLLQNRPGTGEMRKAMMGRAVVGLQKLVKEAEQTEGAEGVRAWAHFALGDVYLNIEGEVQKARREYQIAFDLCQQLAEVDPKNEQAQHDLSISYSKLGDVLLRQGEVAKALVQYQARLKISKRVGASNPNNTQSQEALSNSFELLGDVLLRQGEVVKALEQYQEGLKISKRLAEANPKDAKAQHDLWVSCNKLGNMLLQQEELVRALEQFQEGLKISKRLAELDPKDALGQRELSISFGLIGNVLLRQRGEVGKAMEQYQEVIKISRRLAEADPRNFEAQNDLVLSYWRLGATAKQALRLTEAALSFEKAQSVLRPWEQAGKLKGTRFATWPSMVENQLRSCQNALQALGDLDALLKLASDPQTELLALRAELLVQQGKQVDAVTAASKLSEVAKTAEQVYRAAAAFAWCSRDKEQQERHAARAVELLGKARDAGFFKDPKNVALLKQAEAFKPLLARDDVKKLLADLEKK